MTGHSYRAFIYECSPGDHFGSEGWELLDEWLSHKPGRDYTSGLTWVARCLASLGSATTDGEYHSSHVKRGCPWERDCSGGIWVKQIREQNVLAVEQENNGSTFYVALGKGEGAAPHNRFGEPGDVVSPGDVFDTYLVDWSMQELHKEERP